MESSQTTGSNSVGFVRSMTNTHKHTTKQLFWMKRRHVSPNTPESHRGLVWLRDRATQRLDCEFFHCAARQHEAAQHLRIAHPPPDPLFSVRGVIPWSVLLGASHPMVRGAVRPGRGSSTVLHAFCVGWKQSFKARSLVLLSFVCLIV